MRYEDGRTAEEIENTVRARPTSDRQSLYKALEHVSSTKITHCVSETCIVRTIVVAPWIPAERSGLLRLMSIVLLVTGTSFLLVSSG
jgi:hypothetical protein